MQSADRQKVGVGESMSDSELVAAAKQGSELAVRVIVQRYNRRLFRVARGVVRDDTEAEDVVQDAYVRAFTKLESFRGEAAFSTWLTRIVLNEALGRLRRQPVTTELSEIETAPGANGGRVIMFPMSSMPPSPESEADRQRVRQVLEQAVDELPDPFRLVFILREIEGLSTNDTSAALSVRAETVKTRLYRARRLMRRAIEQRLSPQFGDLFPFDGERCARMADRVVARLQTD